MAGARHPDHAGDRALPRQIDHERAGLGGTGNIVVAKGDAPTGARGSFVVLWVRGQRAGVLRESSRSRSLIVSTESWSNVCVTPSTAGRPSNSTMTRNLARLGASAIVGDSLRSPIRIMASARWSRYFSGASNRGFFAVRAVKSPGPGRTAAHGRLHWRERASSPYPGAIPDRTGLVVRRQRVSERNL